MVGLIRKKVATQNTAKNPSKKSKKDDGHPPNLVLQRFFGLVFHDELMEKLPWNPSEKLKMAKVFPMSSFKPTLHIMGYKQQRPMSRAMIKVLPKGHWKSYRHGFRRPKPVPKED